MIEIGKRIKKIREMRKWSQAYAAKQAGMHERALQNYELGLRNPKEEQLYKLAVGLGVDLAFFYPRPMDTPRALFAVLLDMMEQYGDIVIKEEGDTVLFGVDGKNTSEVRLLQDAAKAHEILSPEEFKEWLMNPYEFRNGKYVDLYHVKLRELNENPSDDENKER